MSVGSHAGYTGSRRFTAMDLGIVFLFMHDNVAVRNVDSLMETDWSVISPYCNRALAVGRRNQSKSMGVALDLE